MRRIFILIMILITVGVLTIFRADIARFVWDQSHRWPELLLTYAGDPELGVTMGNYYFDNAGDAVSYDITRADQLYAQAIALDESVATAWFQRARIAFLKAEHDRALSLLAEYRAHAADAGIDSYYLEGLLHAFKGDLELALTAFEKFYQYDDTSWYIHNNLAWVYFRLGKYRAMHDITVQGLLQSPGNPWLLMSHGTAQLNLGNRELARTFFTQAKETADGLTEDEWLRTYPGNDPAIAERGLSEFRETLRANQRLLHSGQ